MTTAAQHKTPFQKTIDGALTNSGWDAYDCYLMSAVAQSNQYLKSTPGFTPLDWHIVKAMVWTETGGPSDPSWQTRPMQIGNPGDPGLRSLFSGRDGGELILPAFPNLTRATATASPQGNIQAGIAYLLQRLAQYGYRTFTSGPVTDYIVRPGDSFARIAQQNGSTIETLEQLNPRVRVIHPGQKIHFQQAASKKVITGWYAITTAVIAHRYNVGDRDYAKKLDYCLATMNQITRSPTCPP